MFLCLFHLNLHVSWSYITKLCKLELELCTHHLFGSTACEKTNKATLLDLQSRESEKPVPHIISVNIYKCWIMVAVRGSVNVLVLHSIICIAQTFSSPVIRKFWPVIVFPESCCVGHFAPEFAFIVAELD